MRCTKCEAENPAGNNFCARCGNALARLCLKCGAENAPTSNFCGKCGAALTALVSIQISESSPTESADVAGERRHLTVLFCDLVGSTGIAARLDPEQWRETVAGYHRAAAEAITRFDGHVAKYLGDGVMAYFGWPEAHDNDATKVALLLGPSHLVAARRELKDRIDLNGNGLLLSDLERVMEKLSEW